MKIFKIIAASLLTISLSANAFSQTVDEIVDKVNAARGGVEKLKAIKSVVQESSMAVQGMEIPMNQTAVAGKGYRMELSVMGNSLTVAVTPDGGWGIVPAMMGGSGSPEDLPADQLKSEKGKIDPAGELFNYKEKGSKIELIGKEAVNGKDAYNLKLTTAGGFVTNYYIDAASYLPVKTKATIAQMGQEFEQEIYFSDFKVVEGVQFPHALQMTSPMGGMMDVKTNKIVVNGTVDENVFKKPAK